MLRLSGRQVSKALCSPSHSLLHDSTFTFLHYPRQMRRLHDSSVLYSGPPSYLTLTRRFSSEPNPISFFVEERTDVDRGNYNFVDIHDPGSADMKGTNTLIMDVDNDILHPKISKLVSIPHLKNETDKSIHDLFMGRSSTRYSHVSSISRIKLIELLLL
jgi:hypothetical protein